MKDTKDDGSIPLGETFSLEEWEAALPPSDFTERVLARVKADVPEKTGPKRASRRWGLAAAGAGIFAVAAAMFLWVHAPAAQGEAIAQERIEVALGSRALAVLEPGASVRWNGDDVVQSRGDVFYRVEPGKRFVVHTPAGDVEVRGTCFAVKVREMQKRDLKAGTIGAALSALAFVAVYEGEVAVSHASGRVDLRAGESAQSGADGVKRLGPDGEKAFEVSAATATAENDDPLDRANRNLVKQVGEYRSRLESVVAEKSDLEAKLKRSEEQLAAGRDGSAPWKSEFDLSNDDWKELAKDGTIKYKLPCAPSRANGAYTAERLSAAGLTSEEGAALKDAHARSNERVWSELKPLCAKAVGSADVAEKIGASTCVHLVFDIENARDEAGTMAARKLVGEIRAGLKPMPRPEDMTPVLKLFLATTGEMSKFEHDLAQTFGAEEAHRIAYSDELCAGQSTWGGSAAKK